MGNKKKAYQASWIKNIMASRDVCKFYRRPPKKRENAKDNNPKWEVSMVWVDRPKLFHSYCYCIKFNFRFISTRILSLAGFQVLDDK